MDDIQMNGIIEEAEGQLGMFPGEETETRRDPAELRPVITAVLFALGRAVEATELAKACGCDTAFARKAADAAAAASEREDGALLIRKAGTAYQMATNPKYDANLIGLVSNPARPVLTEVVLETLAIIACKAPATKMDVEIIRGVKSDHAFNKLIEYGLIEEAGRKNTPGRPMLFVPTAEFFRRFGVGGKAELPSVDPVTAAMIEEEVMGRTDGTEEIGV